MIQKVKKYLKTFVFYPNCIKLQKFHDTNMQKKMIQVNDIRKKRPRTSSESKILYHKRSCCERAGQW